VKKRKNGAVTHEAFVRAWQGAASRREAAAAVGMSGRGAAMRAMRLRKAEVPLKKMPRGRPPAPFDVTELAQLAARLTRIAKSAAKVKP
jgi:hypothetical protein